MKKKRSKEENDYYNFFYEEFEDISTRLLRSMAEEHSERIEKAKQQEKTNVINRLSAFVGDMQPQLDDLTTHDMFELIVWQLERMGRRKDRSQPCNKELPKPK